MAYTRNNMSQDINREQGGNMVVVRGAVADCRGATPNKMSKKPTEPPSQYFDLGVLLSESGDFGTLARPAKDIVLGACYNITDPKAAFGLAVTAIADFVPADSETGAPDDTFERVSRAVSTLVLAVHADYQVEGVTALFEPFVNPASAIDYGRGGGLKSLAVVAGIFRALTATVDSGEHQLPEGDPLRYAFPDMLLDFLTTQIPYPRYSLSGNPTRSRSAQHLWVFGGLDAQGFGPAAEELKALDQFEKLASSYAQYVYKNGRADKVMEQWHKLDGLVDNLAVNYAVMHRDKETGALNRRHPGYTYSRVAQRVVWAQVDAWIRTLPAPRLEEQVWRHFDAKRLAAELAAESVELADELN